MSSNCSLSLSTSANFSSIPFCLVAGDVPSTFAHAHNPISTQTSLIIFPQAGPDVKYFLGFVRTQLSTTTTVVLVFAPKVLRVLRGQGDQLDHRARVRGITASFSMNGIGLVPEDSPDLYQENEELKVPPPIQCCRTVIHLKHLIGFRVWPGRCRSSAAPRYHFSH